MNEKSVICPSCDSPNRHERYFLLRDHIKGNSTTIFTKENSYACTDDFHGIELNPGPTLCLSGIQAQVGFLQGKVLTIIDAAYHNPTQNKAVKDLLKQAFSESLEHIGNLSRGETGCTIEGRGQVQSTRGKLGLRR